MKVSDGKIITFQQKILNSSGKLVRTLRRKTLFHNKYMNKKLYDALDKQQIDSLISLHYSRDELGKHDSEKVLTIPISNIKGVNALKVGMLFKTTTEEGQALGHITEINESDIRLDTNNFLRTLDDDVTFEIIVTDIETPKNSTAIDESRQFSEVILPTGESIVLTEDPF